MKSIEEEIKQTVFVNSHQKVMLNIIYTASWLDNKHRAFFKQFGITTQQFNILRILKGQYPSKISGTEIKSRMLDQNSDVSRLLDRMILKELISKSQCPNDKRSDDVILSDKGLKLLQKINKEIDAIEKPVTQLSDEEATQLSLLLDKFRD
jgi:DNA-binding MarR family transcriptional regulator